MGLAHDIALEVWISVFAALGVQDYFTALEIPTRIKWPNDILLDGMKVGGLPQSLKQQVENWNL
jgi:biotin-(acetyl-CoA carboxylase) ligase